MAFRGNEEILAFDEGSTIDQLSNKEEYIQNSRGSLRKGFSKLY